VPKAKAKKRFRRRYILDIIVAVVAGGLIIFGLWRTINQPRPLCEAIGEEHQLTLQNDAFSTSQLTVHTCDVIKIINLDSLDYQLAFGVHDKHVDYPGFTETLVRPNEFITVDAVEAGDFRIHDHLRDKAVVELLIIPTVSN